MSLLVINPEYQSSLPALAAEEYKSLKNSIKSQGQHYPIAVNKDLVILDGHHRFKICQELELTPKYEIKNFDNKLEERKFAYKINLQRRHLNDFQKAEMGYKLQKLESEKAKSRQLAQLNNAKIKLNNTTTEAATQSIPLGSIDHNDDDGESKGRTIEIIANSVAISPKQYQRALKIIEYGTEETKKRLRAGNSKIFKEYKKILKCERIQKAKSTALLNSPELTKVNPNVDLKLGDMRDKGLEIDNSSIDLIFTDLPYDKESVPLYGDLAKLAQRVLKPGGSLITFMSHVVDDDDETDQP